MDEIFKILVKQGLVLTMIDIELESKTLDEETKKYLMQAKEDATKAHRTLKYITQ